VSSWVEQAADRAVKLAEELATRSEAVHAAAHLTYMAGLVRGLLLVTMDEHIARRFASGVRLDDANEVERELDTVTEQRTDLLADLGRAEELRRWLLAELDLRPGTPDLLILDNVRRLVRELKESRKEHAEAAREWRHVEQECDELLRDIDTVQRDPNVPLVTSVNHLIQAAGVLRQRPRSAPPQDDPVEQKADDQSARIMQLRAQRDDLLSAAEALLNADASRQTVAARGLRDVIARVQGQM